MSLGYLRDIRTNVTTEELLDIYVSIDFENSM